MFETRRFTTSNRHFEIKAVQVGDELAFTTFEDGKPLGTKIFVRHEIVADALMTGVGEEFVREIADTIERDIRRSVERAKTKPTSAATPKNSVYVTYSVGGGRNGRDGPYSSTEEAVLAGCKLIDQHGRARIHLEVVNEDGAQLCSEQRLSEVYESKYLPTKGKK